MESKMYHDQSKELDTVASKGQKVKSKIHTKYFQSIFKHKCN